MHAFTVQFTHFKMYNSAGFSMFRVVRLNNKNKSAAAITPILEHFNTLKETLNPLPSPR